MEGIQQVEEQYRGLYYIAQITLYFTQQVQTGSLQSIVFSMQITKKIKIGLIGPTNVGKTHFLHAFLFGEDNTHDICPTLAVEFYERVIVLGQYEVAVRIWDSSGNQKYRSIVPHHLRECELIVLMYDITDQLTLDQLQEWINLLSTHNFSLSTRKLLVIGNKLDLVRQTPHQREVSYQQVKQFLASHKLCTTDIYEVSSLLPSKEDVEYIRSIISQILMEMVREEDNLEQHLLAMKVKLGRPGITVTQSDEKHDQTYCGECTIY